MSLNCNQESYICCMQLEIKYANYRIDEQTEIVNNFDLNWKVVNKQKIKRKESKAKYGKDSTKKRKETNFSFEEFLNNINNCINSIFLITF